ncbi:glycosyltransferase family 4 protein [Sphingomonas sp.]|uniref:glycosyltransferase family 4 protein n=1 Tax=Sphingomonas sp. TaxID=28214 RepID=UPI0031D23E47
MTACRRLLLLTSEFDPFRGGIGTYARELAAAAAAMGDEVVVYAPDYGADQTALDAGFPFEVIRYHGGPATLAGLPGRVRSVAALMARRRFDIVHAIDWPFFLPLRMAVLRERLFRRTTPKILLTVHGSEIIYMQAPKRRVMLDATGFWRRGWATWIANSDYTRELLHRGLPRVARDDSVAIPLAVSDHWLEQRVDRVVGRERMGLGEDSFVILSLGRVVPRKGHGVIAEALASLPPEVMRHWKWWVVGPAIDEDFSAELRRKVAALPIEVEITGPLPFEEVRHRLAAADLFCLPGYQDEGGRVEGFGLVFIEAGAYGVPALATRSGGIPEAVADGESGLLVAEHDVAAVAQAFERLADDKDLRARLSRGARQKAEGMRWSDVAARTYGTGQAGEGEA